ncbi:MAG: Nucleosomal histone H3-Lys79 methylase [Bogoriella megaspora]|nr:MAG: Nucleosomal histone H3-Lys79 methylase [Bogoriella megaspora]
MSFFFGGKKGNAKVRTVTQSVQKKPTPKPQTLKVPPKNGVRASKSPSTASPRPSPKRSPKAPVAPRERVVSARSRNSSTPTQQFSSSESEDENEDDEIDLAPARKRQRLEEGDLDRKLCAIGDEDGEEFDGENATLVVSADVTSKDTTSGLKPAFEDSPEVRTVELQFQLVFPKQDKDYRPLVDIIESVEQIILHYFPPTTSKPLLDESNGYPARLRRAVHKQRHPDFLLALNEWNAYLSKSVANGTIITHLSTKHTLPLPLVEKIYWQTYARTVSPRVDSLRRYNAGSDDVYGELLPRFIHSIIQDTHLRSQDTFLDLGSGVGNAVLQAALEAGCEAWGVELESTRAEIASQQARDFRARCKTWGLRIGDIHLRQGDLTTHPDITAILPKADVILVNNEKFQPALNDTLLQMFLDLKDGARIISLKPFAPEGKKVKVNERNENAVTNLLRSERKYWGSGSVSWTDAPGEYHLAVKVPYGERVNGGVGVRGSRREG